MRTRSCLSPTGGIAMDKNNKKLSLQKENEELKAELEQVKEYSVKLKKEKEELEKKIIDLQKQLSKVTVKGKDLFS
jgi:hypothetical protein